jgi:polyhydroxybutyrate depolymerase
MSMPTVQSSARRRSGSWTLVVSLSTFVLAAGLAVAFGPSSPADKTLAPADSGGKYVVHRPANLSRSKPVPLLVVCCRGLGLQPQFGVRQLADAQGFVAVAIDPAKVYNSPSESGLSGSMLPDIQYLKNVIDAVTASENIDPARIYVAGVSQGAFFSLRAACDLSTTVAAVGAIAGGNGMQPCSPSRPVSVIDINGGRDPYVPISLGQAVANRWRATNRCAAQPRDSSTAGVSDQLWTGCALKTGVEFVVVSNAGHAWIRTSQFDSTQKLWQFFSQHPLVPGSVTAPMSARLIQVRVLYRPRRVAARLTLGQRSSVQLALVRGSRTVTRKRTAVPAGTGVVTVGVPRSARGGTYKVKIVVTAGDSARSFSRNVRITR